MFAHLNFTELLQGFAACPDLLALSGGGDGWSYVALPADVLPLHNVDALPALAAGRAQAYGPGWPALIDGGAFFQCDYEFPVGANACAFTGSNVVRGRLWQLRAWIGVAPDGSHHYGGDRAYLQSCFDAALATQALPALHCAQRPEPHMSAVQHQAGVEDIVARIHAGDFFQANLTLPFTATIAEQPLADVVLWHRLQAQAPGLYGCLLRHGGRSIISHSPECFVRSDGTTLVSEPIKGTRKRIAGDEQRVRQELLATAKDRAELAMIIDLVRNDLGRIAQPGSVHVDAAASIMDLDYVHHLVAKISARMHDGMTVADILRAAFPPGSITGAPKISAMQRLDALEVQARGPYCGTFGWIGAGNRCVLSVAIRTMTLTGTTVRFDAGGGIVADSQPAAEWAEVLAKQAVMGAAVTGENHANG